MQRNPALISKILHFGDEQINLSMRRYMLIGTIALGALATSMGRAHAGPDACVVIGSVVTCSGDQAASISSPADFNAAITTTLNVNKLTGSINPIVAGTAGVRFLGPDGANIITNVNTGRFAIEPVGIGSIFGIEAGVNGNGNSTVNFWGNISTPDLISNGISNVITGNGNVATTNNGTISTTGLNSRGISHQINADGNSTIINNGNISTAGASSIGIFSLTSGNGDVNVSNSGNVNSAQSSGLEIELTGAGNVFIIHNAGTISGVTGILSNAPSAQPVKLSISGDVIGTGGTAINLMGDGNDVMNLNAGASIIGAIDFGNGNDGMGGTNINDVDTLNVGPGFNGVVNFADAGGPQQGNTDLQSAPEIINIARTSASNLTNGGTQLSIVDKTGFAASGSFLNSLSQSVTNSLGYGSFQRNVDSDRWFWGAALGGVESISAGANNTKTTHRHGGFIAGVNAEYDEIGLGLFGGYSANNLNFDYNAGNLKARSYFAGVDLYKDFDQFHAELSIFGGRTDHTFTRVMGTTSGIGEYNGWFVAPSVTLSKPITALSIPAIASFRAGYSGLFLDGYTETGTVANPLTAGARNIHQINGRAQIELPGVFSGQLDDASFASFRFGVDGYVNVGTDNVDVSVAGGNFNFSANTENQIGGFVGAGFKRTFGSATFTSSVELQAGTAGFGAAGSVKYSVKF